MFRRERALKGKRQKTIFSLILIAAMLLTITIPTAAVADGEETTEEFLDSRERIIRVGETTTLEYVWEQNADIVFDVQEQNWSSSNTDVVIIGEKTNILTEGDKVTGSSVTITGLKAGTVTVSYKYEVTGSYPEGSRLNSNTSLTTQANAVIYYKFTVVDEGNESTFMLVDDIIDSGNLVINPGYTDAHSEDIFKWYRSKDGINWEQVERKRVSGSQYNLSEDSKRLNVALDAMYMNADSQKYFYKATAELPEEGIRETEPFQVEYYDTLQNGSFEEPAISSIAPEKQFLQIKYDDPKAEELIWKTTAPDNAIELTNGNPHGVTVKEGNQAAEINSSFYGAMYQDLLTVPGSTVYWNLLHAKRGSGAPDVMAVVIMDAKEAQDYYNFEKLNNLMKSVGANSADFKDGYYDVGKSQVYVARCSTTKEENWKKYGESYQVPDGQYLTRFLFLALNATNSGTGNLIDNVQFSREVPAPDPGKGNLEVKKTVTGLSEEVIKGYSLKVTLSDDEGTTDLTHTITEWTPVEGLENTFEGSTVFTGLPVSKDDKAINYKLTEEASGVDSEKYVLMDSSNTSRSMSLEEGKTTSAELKNEYECLKTDAEFKKVWEGEGSDAAIDSITVAMTGEAEDKTVTYTGAITSGGGTLAKSDDSTDVINVDVVTEGSSWNIEVKNLPKYVSSAAEVAAGKGEEYTWSVEEKQVNGVTFALKNGKMTAAKEGVGRWVQTTEEKEGIIVITNTLTSSPDPTPPIGSIDPITPDEPDKSDDPGTEVPESPGGAEEPEPPEGTDNPDEPDDSKDTGSAEAPESPDDHENSDCNAAAGEAPKTGDKTDILCFVALLACSAIGMAAIARRLYAKGGNRPFL